MLKIDEGYALGIYGLHISEKVMKDIKEFYEKAKLQKYIFENFKVTEEQALDIAEKVHELLHTEFIPEYENNIMVDEAIYEIQITEGIPLEDREDDLEFD